MAMVRNMMRVMSIIFDKIKMLLFSLNFICWCINNYKDNNSVVCDIYDTLGCNLEMSHRPPACRHH